jgi:hypothetical protein
LGIIEVSIAVGILIATGWLLLFRKPAKAKPKPRADIFTPEQ